MGIIIRFAQAYIIIFFIAIFFLSNRKIKKNQYKIIVALFVVSMTIEAYGMDIGPLGGDIIRHFNQLKDIKNSSLSFFDFVFNPSTSVSIARYSQLYSFNIIRYLIAFLTDDYYWLPTICVATETIIYIYILSDWNVANNGYWKTDVLSLLIYFACMPFIFAISGIRNVLAISIAGLAIYLYLYKNKHIWIYILLNFIAATIHPASLLTIPFVFFAKLNLKKSGIIAVFFISLGSSFVANLLAHSNIPYFQIIGREYYTYTSEDQYRSSKFMLYGDILLLIIFIIVCFLNRKYIKKCSAPQQRIYNFLILYMIYILGNIGNFDMILRPTYLIGAFSPIISNLLYNKIDRKISGFDSLLMSLFRIGLLSATAVICIYVNVKFMMAYWEWFIGRF